MYRNNGYTSMRKFVVQQDQVVNRDKHVFKMRKHGNCAKTPILFMFLLSFFFKFYYLYQIDIQNNNNKHLK